MAAGGGGAIREVMTAERGKLETALKAFLTPEQATQAGSILGTFNPRWDMMVNALDGMGLEEKVKADAMKAVTEFVAESAKAREAAGDDRNAARAKTMELREKLDGELGKILSADQLAKWKESTAFRRGGGGSRRESPGNTPAAGAPAPAAPHPLRLPRAQSRKKRSSAQDGYPAIICVERVRADAWARSITFSRGARNEAGYGMTEMR